MLDTWRWLYVEAIGCDDIHVFAGVRKLRNGAESIFEGSYGFSGKMVSHGMHQAVFGELDDKRGQPWQPVHTYSREQRLGPGEIVPVDTDAEAAPTPANVNSIGPILPRFVLNCDRIANARARRLTP